MTSLYILAMIGGLSIILYLPVSKNRIKRLTSQGAGGAVFGIGIIGLVFSLMQRAI